ncbi:MAG TPA: glycosyltransferase family 10 [Anaerolineaceae bacterium]|nr:glycosyltransferase family 10 [Anaerolineaceae bacterium]
MMKRINKIHLAGGYGIPEIVAYQKDRKLSTWNYPSFFPFWEILPGVPVYSSDDCQPDDDTLLIVINLNQKVWDKLAPQFSYYKQRALVQSEGVNLWEMAYELAPQFDVFFNFDYSYKDHPGFKKIYIPYDASFGSSHRDQRGLDAWIAQWRHSRRIFLSIYALRYFPRKQKAVMITTLNPLDRYQNRLRAATKWKDFVDVFGRGWPKDLPNYRGICMSKADTFRRYKFALVYENQRQPGYVTEKFLDCLLDATVPIYWGDPTLESFLPATMIYPIADENDSIEPIIKDEEGYRQRRAAIKAHRQELFEIFSTSNFVKALREGLSIFA